MLSREDFHMIKQIRQQRAHIVDIAHRIGCSEHTENEHPTSVSNSKTAISLTYIRDFREHHGLGQRKASQSPTPIIRLPAKRFSNRTLEVCCRNSLSALPPPA